ncbi:glycosyltransferase family 2 protein [Tundrisphaera lichenicola]|uniref:glycosyltransferase family 2 protein n=1 Tax=Tundrisphaera lichenicola TaxID=2029860 RepID=UPI003EB8D7D5
MNLLDLPKLTVVIPTCNGSRHLRETLASIRAQKEAAFDLVISDDRSDDETLAIVQEEVGDRARVSVNSERLGLAGNWNRCVDLSQTEWVAIFHQDDVMQPGHLAAHRPILDPDTDPRLGLFAGPVMMIDDLGSPVSPKVVDPGGLVERSGSAFVPKAGEVVFPPGEWLPLLRLSNPLRCSAVTIRKSAHQEVGGFDPSYRYVVDWDFWARVAQGWGLAWRFGPPTVAMRWHLASETHRFKTGTSDLDEQIRLLDRLNPPESTSTLDLRSIDERLARGFLNRAHDALKGGNATLARSCLSRSIKLSRSVLMTMAADPRLAVQMGVLTLAPEQASRWFARRR